METDYLRTHRIASQRRRRQAGAMHGDLANRIDALEDLLADRLHVRGRTLGAKLVMSRGRLPRRLRLEAQELAQAQAMLGAPATAAKLDPTRLATLCTRLERHLEAVPPRKYARRDRSALFGITALRLLILLIAIGAILVWRGQV